VKERQSWIRAAVLVVIAGALAAYIFLVETRRDEPPMELGSGETRVDPLWEVDQEAIVSITIERGDERGAVERSDGEWRVVAPEEREASQVRVDFLLDDVAEPTPERALEDVGDLTAFGLGDPQARLTVGVDDGTTFELFIGDQNPGGTGYYTQLPDSSAVYLLGSSSVDQLFRLIDDPPYMPTPMPTASPVEPPPPES